MAKDTTSAKQATGQKFIARNRAPRVQIEYDVELYGSERKVEIPFVMGVVADLAGQSEKPLPEFEQRRFLEIDIDNFDERLKAIEPRVAMNVKNDIAGEGRLAVDLRFESINDFSPASIARQVPALDQLLQARSQLSNLLSYMDGKSRAEELIAQALANPKLLAALTGAPKDRDARMDEKKEEGK